MKDKYLRWALLAPTLGILLTVVVYPTFYSAYLSFHSYNLMKPQEGMRWVFLGNFSKLLHDPYLSTALRNSLIITLFGVAIEFLLGFVLALVVRQTLRLHRILVPLVLIPMMLMPVVVGFLWRFMFNLDFGVINQILAMAGFGSVPWLSDPKVVLASVILVDIWHWTPFMFLILFAGLTSLPREPYEAALIGGASRWEIFWHITLPLLKPVIAVALLLRVIDIFKLFDEIYVMTLGGPGNASETLSSWIYKVGMRFFDVGYAAALTYFMLFTLTGISWVFMRVLWREEGRRG